MNLPETVFLIISVIAMIWALVELIIWRQNFHIRSMINRMSAQYEILNKILHEIQKDKKQKTIKNKKRKS